MKEKVQRSYTPDFKSDAVRLSQEIGASSAAEQLKMPVDTLYTWISRSKQGKLPGVSHPSSPKTTQNMSERIKGLEQELKMVRSENAQIRRENQILEEAASFFAARRKK